MGEGRKEEEEISLLQHDKNTEKNTRIISRIHWKDWCWSWNSNTLATWCKELKRPWCWEGLKAGGEGDDRGWDGWMASPTRWTWIWVNSGRWGKIGKPGVLQVMDSERFTEWKLTAVNMQPPWWNGDIHKCALHNHWHPGANFSHQRASCKVNTPHSADLLGLQILREGLGRLVSK